MNDNSQVQTTAVVEDATTFTDFINLSGDLSKALYLATHPEENDEVLRPIVIQ